MKKFLKPVLLATCLLLFFTAGCAKPVDLSLKFDEGRTLTYVHTNLTTVTTSMMGVPLNLKQEVVVRIDHKALPMTAQGNRRIEQVIRAIRTDIGFGGFSFSFDTEADKPDPVADILRLMVGMPVYLTVDAQGEVIRVEGLDQMKQALLESEELKNFSMMQQGKGLSAMLGEQFPKSFAGVSYFPVPAKPVRVGDSWTANRNINYLNFGDLECLETLTLETLENNIATVRSKPEIKGNLLENGLDISIPGSVLQFKITQLEMNGVYKYDAKQGRLLEQSVESQFTLEGSDANLGKIPLMVQSTQLTRLQP